MLSSDDDDGASSGDDYNDDNHGQKPWRRAIGPSSTDHRVGIE